MWLKILKYEIFGLGPRVRKQRCGLMNVLNSLRVTFVGNLLYAKEEGRCDFVSCWFVVFIESVENIGE